MNGFNQLQAVQDIEKFLQKKHQAVEFMEACYYPKGKTMVVELLFLDKEDQSFFFRRTFDVKTGKNLKNDVISEESIS